MKISPTDAFTWAAAGGCAATALTVGALQNFCLVLDDQAILRGALLVVAPLAIALYVSLRKTLSFVTGPSHAFAQFSALAIAVLFVQFPLASLNRPAIDEVLVRFDGLFGANWPDHFGWVIAHPIVFYSLYFVYRSLLFQVGFVCAIIGARDPRRLRIFMFANTLALLTTITLATVLPAGGAFVYYFAPPYPAEMATQFAAVRSGELRVLNPMALTGIIAFPSYHTILALLVGLSFTGRPRLRLFVLTYQALIVFSTRAIGGHYYADIIAGLTIGITANWIAATLHDRQMRSDHAGLNASGLTSQAKP